MPTYIKQDIKYVNELRFNVYFNNRGKSHMELKEYTKWQKRDDDQIVWYDAQPRLPSCTEWMPT